MGALSLAAILLLAISSNVDNIGIGISYGIRKINIPFSSNLLIGVITSCGTLLAMLVGQSVYLFLNARMAGLVGGCIVIAAGVWVVVQQTLLQRSTQISEPLERTSAPDHGPLFSSSQVARILNNPIIADRDFSGHIDLKEAIALALGLTVNNIPNGVGAGMLGLSPAIMTPAVLLTSILTIWLGIAGGHLGSRRTGDAAAWISGLVLIAIGALEIVFH